MFLSLFKPLGVLEDLFLIKKLFMETLFKSLCLVNVYFLILIVSCKYLYI